jgi:hypothetical protein
MIRWAVLAGLISCAPLAAAAEPAPAERHWPQFRGPLGNGVAPAAVDKDLFLRGREHLYCIRSDSGR